MKYLFLILLAVGSANVAQAKSIYVSGYEEQPVESCRIAGGYIKADSCRVQNVKTGLVQCVCVIK